MQDKKSGNHSFCVGLLSGQTSARFPALEVLWNFARYASPVARRADEGST